MSLVYTVICDRCGASEQGERGELSSDLRKHVLDEGWIRGKPVCGDPVFDYYEYNQDWCPECVAAIQAEREEKERAR